MVWNWLHELIDSGIGRSESCFQIRKAHVHSNHNRVASKFCPPAFHLFSDIFMKDKDFTKQPSQNIFIGHFRQPGERTVKMSPKFWYQVSI